MLHSPLNAAIMRGALIAAANCQVTVIQASAGSLFKMPLAAPIIGGLFFMALAVGSEPASRFALEWRQVVATIASSLFEYPVVFSAFLSSVEIVTVGGSMFVFLAKAGTVAILARSDSDAGAIEEPPLHARVVARVSRFTVDAYVKSARASFPRYVRRGFILMGVYLVSGAWFLMLAAQRDPGPGWSLTPLLTALFVLWITLVNLHYLLIQTVLAAADCSVATASRRVTAFIRRKARHVYTVLLLVLALILAVTGAAVLATAALGLVAFVPFLSLAALPPQLLAWLLRGLVFQYISLTSVGAYLRLDRTFEHEHLGVRPRSSLLLDELPSRA